MNILGHNLIFIKVKCSGHTQYVCFNCKCDVDEVQTISGDIEYLIWNKYYHIDMISCNEYIIKDIIE